VLTQVLLASFSCQYPWSTCEWRLMPHMLSMAAGQVGHPIAVFILMKTNNRLLHQRTSLAYAIVSANHPAENSW
jgi:hypothetical protein